MASRHRARDLERLFAETFSEAHGARLEGGAAEPEYLPGPPARLRYREDYFASALHEVAHWCIAGHRRRALPDYGYWYIPDGRDASAQQAFEAAEARPQALEWCFSLACGAPFRLSFDNLEAASGGARKRFEGRVLAEARRLRDGTLPPRARSFLRALARFYGGEHELSRWGLDVALPQGGAFRP